MTNETISIIMFLTLATLTAIPKLYYVYKKRAGKIAFREDNDKFINFGLAVKEIMIKDKTISCMNLSNGIDADIGTIFVEYYDGASKSIYTDMGFIFTNTEEVIKDTITKLLNSDDELLCIPVEEDKDE